MGLITVNFRRKKKVWLICLFFNRLTALVIQGSTVRAFHSHLRLKIDVCELENIFRSMSANTKQNTKQPNLYSSQ